MAAGAEVSGEAAVLGMESPAAVVEPSSPKNTIPTSEKNLEKYDNSNTEKAGETDVADGVKDSDLNSNSGSKSELEMKELVDMWKKLKLNPLAKEFVPSSQYQGQMGAFNFVPINKNLGNDGFPNHQRRRNNYNQSRKRMNGRAFRAQREDSIRRTVYVSDIDHNAESAILALDCCGELLGSQRIRVSPSKTPVRPRVSHPGAQCLNTLLGYGLQRERGPMVSLRQVGDWSARCLCFLC
ncbi:UNVERIFIED_CONTAM: Polyadenylate-binding protein-interacting protein 8 [Sesamum radiatum]|uniref:Polyadenylate-binding protein-interacting protein 8 n=1 Tax=Sesamum radiatum TaxID=300843 RepID=A0AAW2T4A1_SESRA